MPSPINNNKPTADQTFVVFQPTTAPQCSPSAPSSTSSIESSSSASSIEAPDAAPIHFEPFRPLDSTSTPAPVKSKRWLITKILIRLFTVIANLFINSFRVIAAVYFFISNLFLKLFGRDAESIEKARIEARAKRLKKLEQDRKNGQNAHYQNIAGNSNPNTTKPKS